MIGLFTAGSEPHLVDFLNRNAERVTLVASPDFVSQLFYAERDGKIGKDIAFEILPISSGVIGRLQKMSQEGGSKRTFIVADPAGEKLRLDSLRADCPNLRIVGLGQDLFPALVARSGNVVLNGMKGLKMPSRIVLMFASPRSGSSVVSDLLSDINMGDVREHLRESVIAAFTSAYRFDREQALRTFLCLGHRNGVFGTKIISHFFEDYIRSPGDLELVQRVCEGIPLQVITLDRQDTVAQAVSGELASKRGVWHVTDERSAAAVEQSREVRFDFNRLLSRYFFYRHQSAVIDFVRHAFPDSLSLDYSADVDTGELDALTAKLRGFLGVPDGGEPLTRASARRRIANEVNDQFTRQFTETYAKYFSGKP